MTNCLAPAHQRLRLATHSAHLRAEDTPIMRRLMAGTLDRAGYAHLLLAHRDFYRSWEHRRGRWLQKLAGAGWHYDSRHTALQADLGALQSAVATHPSDAMAVSPAMVHACGSWGELYVVEGSALGGRVLARKLVRRFPDLPHHFFNLGQRAGRPTWRHFQAMLDQQLNDEECCAAAIDGAQEMFASMRKILQQADAPGAVR